MDLFREYEYYTFEEIKILIEKFYKVYNEKRIHMSIKEYIPKLMLEKYYNNKFEITMSKNMIKIENKLIKKKSTKNAKNII